MTISWIQISIHLSLLVFFYIVYSFLFIKKIYDTIYEKIQEEELLKKEYQKHKQVSDALNKKIDQKRRFYKEECQHKIDLSFEENKSYIDSTLIKIDKNKEEEEENFSENNEIIESYTKAIINKLKKNL
jgi:hypothetical protein